MLRRSAFLNNVLTLVTGTAIAQALGIALAIPLARLYTPSDFGHFAIFSSISAFAATIASLRYDLAIVLPKSDSVAKQVRRLASRCILITSAVTSLLRIAGAGWIGQTYQSRPLTICLFFAGISVYEVAELSNVQYWLTRKIHRPKPGYPNHWGGCITTGVLLPLSLGGRFVPRKDNWSGSGAVYFTLENSKRLAPGQNRRSSFSTRTSGSLPKNATPKRPQCYGRCPT